MATDRAGTILTLVLVLSTSCFFSVLLAPDLSPWQTRPMFWEIDAVFLPLCWNSFLFWALVIVMSAPRLNRRFTKGRAFLHID